MTRIKARLKGQSLVLSGKNNKTTATDKEHRSQSKVSTAPATSMEPPPSSSGGRFRPCDEAVIATNDDASESKRCAVQLGYWKDDYIAHFVKNSVRKAPEINRGYFARVRGVEMCLDRIFQKIGDQQPCQIINLGCGFDSLYWRLPRAVTNFVEVDFPTVTAKKCYNIKRNKHLLEKLNNEDGDIRLSPTDLHATNYHLIGVDLRNTEELIAKFKISEVNFDLPTIFLAECVLVYMEPNNCFNLLRGLSKHFPNAAFINYEQVNLNDRFGEVMLTNLRARGCTLAGVESCLSLETQIRRFTECGWSGKAWDMIQVYNALPSSERQRIERIEMLDERELLDQLFQHYCITVGWTGEVLQNIEITMEQQMSSLNID